MRSEATGIQPPLFRINDLGIVSMQECLHLVLGQFSVSSSPGLGTKILAVVPLAVEGE
jgi:hypothetical protein